MGIRQQTENVVFKCNNFIIICKIFQKKLLVWVLFCLPLQTMGIHPSGMDSSSSLKHKGSPSAEIQWGTRPFCPRLGSHLPWRMQSSFWCVRTACFLGHERARTSSSLKFTLF
jgi:hypothetical protein